MGDTVIPTHCVIYQDLDYPNHGGHNAMSLDNPSEVLAKFVSVDCCGKE